MLGASTVRKDCFHVRQLVKRALRPISFMRRSDRVHPMQEISMVFETLKVSKDGAVLFVDIAAPSMNL